MLKEPQAIFNNYGLVFGEIPIVALRVETKTSADNRASGSWMAKQKEAKNFFNMHIDGVRRMVSIGVLGLNLNLFKI